MTHVSQPLMPKRDDLPSDVVPEGAFTVYFDGACPVCSKEIAFYRSRKVFVGVDWVDASSCTDADLPGNLSREQALARFHILQPNQTLCSGPSAFGLLWARVPGLAWLGKLMEAKRLQPVLEWLYRQFLSVRSHKLDCTAGRSRC